ncbi:hypothetical protein [Prevotella sp. E13-27]|uniref:hypothetical protein n=1 Tax=Prevotella sp. E13-27 TaxID=2938122 RepID=UPI00200AC584|nr:hypothetical protein [Prevotella sp. E13-27]MCK8621898.1 hypothetical protein [Prevotella sp. E13-27]
MLTAFPTDEELMFIAESNHSTYEATKELITKIFNDLQQTQAGILDDIHRNAFHLFPDNQVKLRGYDEEDSLSQYFLCHYNANWLKDYKEEEIALVTGFGPSNAPTAGTLSMIFRMLDIQRRTNITVHAVIADLGFINFREAKVQNIINTTQKFLRFIKALGFDETKGSLRSQNSLDLYRTFAMSSSVLSLSDFIDNMEATTKLYNNLNLQGKDFSTLVHYVICVADILMPILRDKKKMVLVMSGIEEFYFTTIARLVIERMKESDKGLSAFVSDNPQICSLFGRLIEGLFPYVKMSKSIPESSINIGDSEDTIRNKIMNCGSRNEHVILDMMNLASDWNPQTKIACRAAYEEYITTGRDEFWRKQKAEYTEFFIGIKQIWDASADPNIDIHDNIYSK